MKKDIFEYDKRSAELGKAILGMGSITSGEENVPEKKTQKTIPSLPVIPTFVPAPASAPALAPTPAFVPEPYKIFRTPEGTYTNIPFPGAKPIIDITPKTQPIGQAIGQSTEINWKGIAELFKDPRATPQFINWATELILNILKNKISATAFQQKQTVSYDTLLNIYDKMLKTHDSLLEQYNSLSMFYPKMKNESNKDYEKRLEKIKADLATRIMGIRNQLSYMEKFLGFAPQGTSALPQTGTK